MKRVLLLIVNDPKYFLSHRLPIAIEAREKGYEVHVASIQSPDAQRIVDLGFDYHTILLERGGINPLRELSAFWGFVKLLWKLRPNILHLVTTKPVLYGGIAARVSPVGGVVSAIAGLGSVYVGKDLRSRSLASIINVMYRLALKGKKTRVIFQNPCDRNLVVQISGIKNNNTVLIKGSGVLMESYPDTPEPSGPLVVTFAGRFIRDKGIYEFIAAARLLRVNYPNVVFQLVGEIDSGNPTSLTEAELDSIVAEKVVRLLGYQTDMARVFSSSHVVVLPSYREGLPKVLIEAAACARAVVTTDVPGCRDAIIADKTGLLVPVRDHHALASSIENLLLNGALRLSMGRAGRELAMSEFTIEKVVSIHMDVYEAIARMSEH